MLLVVSFAFPLVGRPHLHTLVTHRYKDPVVLAIGGDRVSRMIRRGRRRDQAYHQIIDLIERAQGVDDRNVGSW